jgi:hypothetical protein
VRVAVAACAGAAARTAAVQAISRVAARRIPHAFGSRLRV